MLNADLYTEWFLAKGIRNPSLWPDDRGVFALPGGPCILPFVRACYATDTTSLDLPSQSAEHWERLITPIAAGTGAPNIAQDANPNRRAYWHRFFRADQLLDWIWTLTPGTDHEEAFTRCLHHLAIRYWLLPIADYQIDRVSLLGDVVQAIWMRYRATRSRSFMQWSRRADYFSDVFRREWPGLDPVHTPENARAGLSRRLSAGWRIDDNGTLCPPDTSQRSGVALQGLGSVASSIPFHLHDAPRRLMLGTSLLTHAVPLKEPVPAAGWHHRDWQPPVCALRVIFRTWKGYNHEDAVVISESASRKLQTNMVHQLNVPVPSVVSRVILDGPGPVQEGRPLAKGVIDLFALDLARHALPPGSEDGMLTVGLDHARSPCRGTLVRSEQYKSDGPGVQGGILFDILSSFTAEVGDKIATWHGIKGVIARVLPDDQMPLMDDDSGLRAELLISPVGVIRRGAIGQLREAGVDLAGRRKSGTILVMRQPQDAAPRCRVRGTAPSWIKGQRYGEMEFWALMAHNVPAVAQELLSASRSTALWLSIEAAESADYRRSAQNALNRYLAAIGARITERRLHLPRVHSSAVHVQPAVDSVPFIVDTDAQYRQFLNLVDDEAQFVSDGNIITRTLTLSRPVQVVLPCPRTIVAESFSIRTIYLPAPRVPLLHNKAQTRLLRIAAGILRDAALIATYMRDVDEPRIYDSGINPLETRQKLIRREEALRKKLHKYIRAVFARPAAPRAVLLAAVLAQRSGDRIGHTAGEPSWSETTLRTPALTTLADYESWISAAIHASSDQRSLLAFPLSKVIDVQIEVPRTSLEFLVSAIHLLPPWLRPAPSIGGHPITKLYLRIALQNLLQRRSRTLLARRQAGRKLRYLVEMCLRETFSETNGAGMFLRREVLGRRLSRSARAVIVPAPDLLVDQIRIPASVAEALFDGLSDECRTLVLVNRNPTLHRRGLLALKPVVDPTDAPVFGVPLQLLKVLGADFDGDQATVVALTTREAIAEAARMRPSAAELRRDRFRPGRVGFPLVKELSLNELEHATLLASTTWAVDYDQLLKQKLQAVDEQQNAGWHSEQISTQLESAAQYYHGLEYTDWVATAAEEMPIVYEGVRKKGRLGGVLRRQLYRRAFIGPEPFADAVDALQTVSERYVQTALSVKSGAGAASFEADKYFDMPSDHKAKIKELDGDLDVDAVTTKLGVPEKPRDLLRWLAHPRVATLTALIQESVAGVSTTSELGPDPRIAWFL